MKRRSKTSRKLSKARQRKTKTPKPVRPSATGQESEVARFKRERDEALEQQTATTEILNLISSSSVDLEEVFQSILTNAVHICRASFGFMHLFENGAARISGWLNVPEAFIAIRQKKPVFRFGPSHPLGRLFTSKQPQHILDARKDKAYEEKDAFFDKFIDLTAARTILFVPILHKDTLLGSIGIFRKTINRFTERQIDLVKSFCAQAAVAIENTRLLNELRQRTDDLAESLEQQTATAEVLRAISSSPGDLEPVFHTMLENATRICEATFGNLFLCEGPIFRAVAAFHSQQSYAEYWRSELVDVRENPGIPLDRIARTKQVVHIADLRSDPSFLPINKRIVSLVEAAGARTFLAVPMLKEGKLIGAIAMYRREVKSFTHKQVELVRNFAAQAVIAIENTRLLNELRESLQQQTATADVLRVISSSPGELLPVFDAMLENATRLCDAPWGVLFLSEGDNFRIVATHHPPSDHAEWWSRGTVIALRDDPTIPLFRMKGAKSIVHVPDMSLERAYIERVPRTVAIVESAGVRTFILVPMIKDDELVGAISMYRQEVRPFTDKQIELVKNFAAQAVIAIENTRLLNETKEALEQQRASAEVLNVISNSVSDAEPAFEKIVESCERIFATSRIGLNLIGPDGLVHAGAYGRFPGAEKLRRENFPHPVPGSATGAAISAGRPIQYPDALSGSDVPQYGRRAAKIVGFRAFVMAPLLSEGRGLGAIFVGRETVGLFSDKEIALLKTFAAQAVIAIENTRLLNELRESLLQQTATSDVLQIISSSPGELEPVFRAMLENATRICEAKFGTLFRFDGKKFQLAAEVGTPPEYAEFQQRRGPFVPPPGTRLDLVMRTKEMSQSADLAAEAVPGPAGTLGGARSTVCVPMLKDYGLIGALVIYRQEVRPFTDKQIELLQNFAAQAVIAIENTRLLNELRESLLQQTATADVLRVISSSPGELVAVFDSILENATRFCAAKFGGLWMVENDGVRLGALYGASPAFAEIMWQSPFIKPGPQSAVGRLLKTKQTIQIDDLAAGKGYSEKEPLVTLTVDVGGGRTLVAVPMLKEDELIGAITIFRQEVQPFTDKQIALVKNFAAQAVIAIENTRLLNELRQRTAELEDKGHQLEVASQHKSQFLANMSHELRTPLNAILGYTELIADGIYGEPTEKMVGVLKRLESNGKHLLGLINDVLDLSKIEAGQLTLELSDYSLQDIAQTVRSTLEPLATDKKLAFKVEVAPKLPPGRGDGRRLTQVLINLVGNAIKFTDAGEVVIIAGANDGAFQVSVQDSGPGISPADQAKLFQEFQQADNAITRKKGGTGLGLAISKHIIEMHGGEIWVESQVGQGSTFSFTIPVRVQQQVEPA